MGRSVSHVRQGLVGFPAEDVTSRFHEVVVDFIDQSAKSRKILPRVCLRNAQEHVTHNRRQKSIFPIIYIDYIYEMIHLRYKTVYWWQQTKALVLALQSVEAGVDTSILTRDCWGAHRGTDEDHTTEMKSQRHPRPCL